MLGLLLVVTFIANYLGTTLPAQMATNDVSHDLAVENQASVFATLVANAVNGGEVGVSVSQPISLGSAGDPPFAGPDGGTLTSGASSSALSVSFSVKSAGGVVSPFTLEGPVGAEVVVHLQNSYAPPADVAFDEGAVVFAQAGGLPVIVGAPGIAYAPNGTLTLLLPQFLGSVGSEAGTGTVALSMYLASTSTLAFPSKGSSLASSVTIQVVSRYAYAWKSYFADQFANLTTNCTGPAAACSGPFGFQGPVGTVTVQVPVKALQAIVGSFTLASG
jgi:hypothetical protein